MQRYYSELSLEHLRTMTLEEYSELELSRNDPSAVFLAERNKQHKLSTIKQDKLSTGRQHKLTILNQNVLLEYNPKTVLNTNRE